MRIDETIYQGALGAIYDAALEPALWPEALTRVSDALSAVGALYLSYDLRRPDQAQHRLARLDPQLTQSYLRRHSRTSPWANVRTSLPVGKAVAIDPYVPPARLVRTDFYREILEPQGVLHCGSVCLARAEGRYVGFSVFRSRSAGPTEDQELRFLSALAPHVKRSTEIAKRLGSAAALRRAERRALDYIGEGVVLTDGQARLLFANHAAEAIIALNDGLLVASKLICANRRADTQRLHALVAEAATGGAGGAIRLARPSCAEPLLVLVAPAFDNAAWPTAVRPAAVIFITDPELTPRLELRGLMDLFGLTATEAKVALALAGGEGAPEAAHRLHLSPNTIHTHMRRIFGKLGVNRQAELVRLLTRLAAVAPPLTEPAWRRDALLPGANTRANRR